MSTNTNELAYKYKELLRLTQFDYSEYKDLQLDFEKQRNSPGETFLQKFNVRIVNLEFMVFQREGLLSANIMAFLLNSLHILQGEKVPMTFGMAVIESPADADFLEFDNMP